jgi:putative transposase
LFSGRPFRALTIVNHFSRPTPLLESLFSLGDRDIIAALDGRSSELAHWYRSRHRVHISNALGEWAYRRGVKLDFIHPGEPNKNGRIESFNGRLLDECLNVMQFESIEDASEKIEAW